jgi:hypothetical protein
MEKGGSGSAVVKSIILVVLGALVVLGLYMLFTRSKKSPTEESYEITVVDEITTTNLERNYPASARKVVDLYIKTMQVLYRETYTDEQQDKMIAVMQGLLDDELLANNPNYVQVTKKEVKDRRAEDYSISAYVMLQTKEPDEVNVGGRKMCEVDYLINLRHGSNGTTANYYKYIMRRDTESGNWKILGWTLKEDEEND